MQMEDLFKSFGWNEALYDPLYDAIEAATEQEKVDLARMKPC
jgi:hypothetical protein